MKTLWVICPHLDDESLSCGGLIYARALAGWSVKVTVIFGRKYPGEEERVSNLKEFEDFKRALRCLSKNSIECQFPAMPEGEPYSMGYYQLLQPLEDALIRIEPQEVVIPSSSDLNQDHRHLADVCKIVFRPANLWGVERILEARAFDAPLSTPQYFVPLSSAAVAAKLEAIACYKREARDGVHPRSSLNVVAMHRVLGSKCGVEFAEGYGVHLIKEVLT